MTAEKTSFAGLTALPPGDLLSDDGYAFQFGDRFIIDRLLRLGAISHLHDAHAALPNPAVVPVIGTNTTGGSIAAGQGIYVCYTWIDADGGETAPTDAAFLTTAPSLLDPTFSPAGVLDTTAGGLLAGSYAYAVTVTDGLGGETIIGPPLLIDVPSGLAHAQIDLSALTALVSNSNPGAIATAGWRLWRQIGGGPWYLIGTGPEATDTFTDNGVAGDCTVQPPFSSTVGATNTLNVTVPAPPGGVVPAQFAVYASYDGSFVSPSLLGIYPSGDAGTIITYTELDVSDGSPPVVSQSFPGADKITPDTELVFGMKSPVSTSSNLPAGNKGDVRVALDSLHMWAVLGDDGAQLPGDWTDLTAAMQASAGNDGLTVAGPGTGSAYDTTRRFKAPAPPRPTGLVLAEGLQGGVQPPLVIPKSISPGDTMILVTAMPVGGEQPLLLDGWDSQGHATTSSGTGLTVDVLTRVATPDDIGQSLRVFTGGNWIAMLRAYNTQGIGAVQMTSGRPNPITEVDATKPWQVNFIAVATTTATPLKVELWEGTTQTTPVPASEYPLIGSSNKVGLSSDSTYGGQEDQNVTLWENGNSNFADASAVWEYVSVTLLDAPATGVGSLADWTIPTTPQVEGPLAITNGLLTTSDPTAVEVYGTGPGGSAPFTSAGDKYAAQWTAPGLVGDGYKFRCHFQMLDALTGQSGGLLRSVVLHMQDGADGLAFWFGTPGIGFTTNLNDLGTVQNDVGNNTYQNFNRLMTTRLLEDSFFPNEGWAEIYRSGNKVHGLLYDADPASGARPFVHLTHDVTGDATYGPGTTGYFGWTADYLSQEQGVIDCALFALNTGEEIASYRKSLDFKGTGGVAVTVVDLDGSNRGNDLPSAAQIIIDGSGITGGGGGSGVRGSDWYDYAGAGTPPAGTFTGEADGDFAVRESDGEVFRRVSGAWVDQSFSLEGPTGATGATGASGSAGARGSDWYDYTGAGTPAAGTFTGEADGDFAVRESDGEVFKRVAGAWTDQGFSLQGPTGPGGGGGGTRTSHTTNLTGLTTGTETNTTLTSIGKSAFIYAVTVDEPCRVRIYATAAQATADISRAVGTDPTGNHGCLLELVFTAAGTWNLSPTVFLVEQDTTPTTAFHANVRCDSGATLNVTLTGFIEEA